MHKRTITMLKTSSLTLVTTIFYDVFDLAFMNIPIISAKFDLIVQRDVPLVNYQYVKIKLPLKRYV